MALNLDDMDRPRPEGITLSQLPRSEGDDSSASPPEFSVTYAPIFAWKAGQLSFTSHEADHSGFLSLIQRVTSSDARVIVSHSRGQN